MKQYWIKACIILVAFLSSSYSTEVEVDYGLKTIVIDAGHGGKDNGCSGATVNEKVVALSIALKLGAYIKKIYPNINVVYTRKKDVFLPLYERAKIANDNKADLFISIHCNAVLNKKSKASGTETFVMGLHTASENLDMVKRENSVILMETDHKKNYTDLDMNSSANHIISSLYQNAHLGQSISLAEKIERQFKFRAKRKSRGVKQAGFAVLRYTAMPSVLVETGFLTHPTEGKFLSTNKGQASIASAIFRAFKGYKQEMEQTQEAPMPRTAIEKGIVVPPTFEPPIPLERLVLVNTTHHTTKQPQIEFKIQLAATYNPLDIQKGAWMGIVGLEIEQKGTLYKYLMGGFDDYQDCKKTQSTLAQKGFKDSFIVAYKNGERIQVTVARKILQNK